MPCGIVHADDTRPGLPFAVPTIDATVDPKAKLKGLADGKHPGRT